MFCFSLHFNCSVLNKTNIYCMYDARLWWRRLCEVLFPLKGFCTYMHTSKIPPHITDARVVLCTVHSTVANGGVACVNTPTNFSDISLDGGDQSEVWTLCWFCRSQGFELATFPGAHTISNDGPRAPPTLGLEDMVAAHCCFTEVDPCDPFP